MAGTHLLHHGLKHPGSGSHSSSTPKQNLVMLRIFQRMTEKQQPNRYMGVPVWESGIPLLIMFEIIAKGENP